MKYIIESLTLFLVTVVSEFGVGFKLSNGLKSILEVYRKIPIAGLAKDYLKRITTLHRVQGSKGLEEAIKITAMVLEDLGLSTRVFRVPSSSRKGFMETPTSWNAENGLIEFKRNGETIAKFDYSDHPTLISAHSPRGEGCGELKHCVNIENCSGEAVLVEAPAFVAYSTVEADLVVLYDSKRYPEAVPYTGLFISRDEVKPKPVVVNVPYATAQRLIALLSKGVRLVACWKVETKYSDEPLPALVAYSGENPGVLFVSHICHPKPGAHDNASGSAVNLAIAKILESSNLSYPHAHLFVPEYTGTIYAREHLPWTPKGVINLDMVGSKQGITGSTLNIVNPPLFIKPLVAAYTFIAVKLVLDSSSSFGGFELPAYRYSITPYTSGSDHDVTIAWGMDSVMLNEWPSKFYHTDMDDVDTISVPFLADIAIAAATAGHMLYTEPLGSQVLEYYRNYVKSWYQIESLKKGVDVSPLSKMINQWETAQKMHELETPISSRFMYRVLGRELYMRIRNIRGAHSYLSVYAPLAYLNEVENFDKLFSLENLLSWSREEEEIINEAWSILVGELG